MSNAPLRIGTRGSPLALAQAAMVRKRLEAAHDGLVVETHVIRTSGDWKPADGENRLSELEGGKGLFVKEIEQALIRGEIDCAVHSLKDVPSFLPEGLAVDHMLPREDPRDAFICRTAPSYRALPEGATVGTSSLRRQVFLLARRPDLKVVPLRGNVATRIAKLDEGLVDATFLARAGLNRLGIAGDHIHTLPVEEMLPACGQGTIAIETRLDDAATRALLGAIHDAAAGLASACERGALQVLDGSCHTPIGAHAILQADGLKLALAVASGDGREFFEAEALAPVNDDATADAFGRELAAALKSRTPGRLFQ